MTLESPAITATEIVLPGLVEPDGLLVRRRELPPPGAGQMVVRVEATGISFAEKSMRRGRYFGQPPFPFVPGYDLVGVVIELGDGVDSSLLGVRVASVTKTGGWASAAIVEARDSIRVPDGLDPAEVETVVVNGLTAWQMLHRKAHVAAGQTIVVHGANSGVGGILIQLAQHEGIRVIGTASPRHHAALRAMGVEPIDYNDVDPVARVREIAPDGASAVFDNVGGTMTRNSYRMLAPGGALVCYAIVAVGWGTGSLIWPFLFEIGRALLWNALPNGHSVSFYDLWAGHRSSPKRFRARLEEDLAQVFALLADGTLTANIAARFPLEQAATALGLAESRTIAGKVILLP
jgi:NADPH:quinone reductase-like Zn-dependent oxidoreductase